MATTAAFIFDYDAVGRSSADRRRLAWDESIDVCPFVAFSGNEIRHNVSRIIG